MKRLSHLAVLMILTCDFNPAADISVADAQFLARRYASKKLRIDAAGDDCRVLLVRASTHFDPTTVETLQYGTSESRYEGGIQQFAEDARFRAVVYRDESAGLWTYGATTLDEARELRPCE